MSPKTNTEYEQELAQLHSFLLAEELERLESITRRIEADSPIWTDRLQVAR